MAVDWAGHYNAIYDALGVAAVLTPIGLGISADLTVIDKTTGVEVTEGGITTVRPACDVRSSDLAAESVAPEHLDGSAITFNGSTWRIEARLPRPAPTGESGGEYRLLLVRVP